MSPVQARALLLTLALLGTAGAQATQLPVTAPTAVTIRDVPAGHWAREAVELLVGQGLLLGFPDGTFKGTQGITRYEAAVIFGRFLQSGQFARAALTQEQVQVLSRGLLEVSDELKDVLGRVAAIEAKNDTQDARLGAVEGALATMNDNLTNLKQASEPAVDARLTNLEHTASTLPALASSLTPKTEHQALEARVLALEMGGVQVPPVVAPLPFPTGPEPTRDGYAGLAVDRQSTFGVTATVGSRALLGPIGGQVGVSYSGGAVSADVAGTVHFGNASGLSPYVGAGAGATFSQGRSTGSATDLYGLGLAGVNYAVTPQVGVFVEGAGRYYLSNAGQGTGLASTDSKGLRAQARIGLRLRF